MSGATGDRKVDVALAAYDAARVEIIERLQMRERLIFGYLAANLTLVGGSVTLDVLEQSRIFLACLMPIFALPVALLVSQHTRSISLLADFIRTDWTTEAKKLGIWFPHWDWYTKKDENTEKEKRKLRFFGTLLSMHGPSVVSLAVGLMLLIQYEAVSLRSANFWFFLVAIGTFSIAVIVSVKSMWNRSQQFSSEQPVDSGAQSSEPRPKSAEE